MALGLVTPSTKPTLDEEPKARTTKNSAPSSPKTKKSRTGDAQSGNSQPNSQPNSPAKKNEIARNVVQDGNIVRVNDSSRVIVYGLQQRAVQGMLDFDFLCKRDTPSVAAMIFPFSGNHYLKFYWGTSEKLIPVYQDIGEAVKKHPDVSVMINFSSFRSVYSTTMEALEHSDVIKTHAIIAEGVPESQTRDIIRQANAKGVGLIGPATVGGIKPGALRIGNT